MGQGNRELLVFAKYILALKKKQNRIWKGIHLEVLESLLVHLEIYHCHGRKKCDF